MAIEGKSIEDSCKELHVWMGRLGKLCHRDKKDLKAYFLKKNIWVDSLENLGYYMESGADGKFIALKNGFQVTDLKSQNAIVANNRVYIIDCCITKHQ